MSENIKAFVVPTAVLTIICLVVSALLSVTFSVTDPIIQENNYRAEQAALSAQVAQVQQENAELSHAVEHKDDPDVLEQVARDKGFVYAQERVFVDPTN